MITFELVTMDGVKFHATVHEVMLPTPGGYVAVFKDHAPLVTLATHGVISIRAKANEPDDMMQRFATHGGVVEIHDNHIRMLVDEADAPEELNEAEVQKALERARELRAGAKDQVSLDHAQSLVDREAVRLQVATLKRRSRPSNSKML